MPLILSKGDIFKSSELGIRALGHGVNCHGAMGAGIAVEFKARWPAMYEEYRMLCAHSGLVPGSLYEYYDEKNDLWIYNLAIKDHWREAAILKAIYESTMGMLNHMRHIAGLRRVAIPAIGVGLGRLSFETYVRPALTEASSHFNDIEILLVRDYIEGLSPVAL